MRYAAPFPTFEQDPGDEMPLIPAASRHPFGDDVRDDRDVLRAIVEHADVLGCSFSAFGEPRVFILTEVSLAVLDYLESLDTETADMEPDYDNEPNLGWSNVR